MIKKFCQVKYLKRLGLVLAALIMAALSIMLHRGTLKAGIPIDYTEDPYSTVEPEACR